MGMHMDLSSAPRVWVKNSSGVGVKVIDPAWLTRQRQVIARQLRLQDMAVTLAARREAKPISQRVVEKAARDQKAAMLAALREKQMEEAHIITESVAQSHGLTAADLLGKDRCMAVSVPRSHAIYEIRRQCPDLMHKQIAEMFGHAHHKIVLRSIEEWPKRARVFGIPCVAMEEKA